MPPRQKRLALGPPEHAADHVYHLSGQLALLRLTEPSVRAFVEHVFLSLGANEDEACINADGIVTASLWWHPGQGQGRIGQERGEFRRLKPVHEIRDFLENTAPIGRPGKREMLLAQRNQLAAAALQGPRAAQGVRLMW